MKTQKNQKGLVGILEILAIALVLGAVGFVGWRVIRANDKQSSPASNITKQYRSNTQDAAIKAGQELTHNECKGQGVPYKLSVSPMKEEDFAIVVPYGLMVGGHVTPIDHQYFSPKDYRSKPDSYEVRAMADSKLVEISSRPRPFGQEYRMVFTISCTFLYYYDLVTSLAPDIQKAYQESQSGVIKKSLSITVKAGQVIGRIGGQTLDFAVWDTTKPLPGFIVPEHYASERWKLYTADPLDYYTADLKALILSRYVRSVPPISGKIDYDVDGRLVGNWFMEGTDGYSGDRSNGGRTYWRTHLSFSPNLYRPDWFVISIGDYQDQKNNEGSQFITLQNTPNPKDVSVETGLVKYDLAMWSYYDDKGQVWDQNSLIKTINIKPMSGQPKACAIVQMLETRKIKFEAFRGKNCSSVNGFSPAAKLYTR